MSCEQPDDASEDGECSPECLLTSEPVKDPYPSDEEKESCRKEKMLKDDCVCSSEICPWEVFYFLNCNFLGINSKVTGDTCEDILKKVFEFYFPDGLPKAYKEKCGIEDLTNWDETVLVLLQLFMKIERNMWLKENFSLDYTCAEGKALRNQRDSRWEYLDVQMNDCGFHQYTKNYALESAYLLAHRMDNLFHYLSEDDNLRRKYDSCKETAYGKNEKHEKIKGVLYDICSYLQIPILYSGEGKVDFTHEHVRDRKTSIDFKIKPDLTLCIPLKWTSEPFAVIKVFGVSSEDVEKISKSIKSKSSCSESGIDRSDLVAMDNMSINPLLSNKTESKSVRVLECVGEEQKSEDLSIYHHQIAITDINNKLREVGPKECVDVKNSQAFIKLLGELTLEMYGMLIHRESSLQEMIPVESESEVLGGLGLFVMNEFVYVSKISHQRWLLSRANCWSKQKDAKEKQLGPTVSYGKDICFNLKRPNDRLAFLCFLHHFYFVQRVERKMLTERK